MTAFFTSSEIKPLVFDLFDYILDVNQNKGCKDIPTLIPEKGKIKFEIPDERLGDKKLKVTARFYKV